MSEPRVPDTLDEALSPAWLTAALGRRFPGVEILASIPGPVVSRVSTNARFRIECAGSRPEGLPGQLCVKGYFGDAAGAGPAGEPEVLFYRDLAKWAAVPTLECFYSDIDPATRHGVIITEDVVAAGAEFLDALSPYSPEQAAASIEVYAGLHARTWAAPVLQGGSWLAPRLANTLRARGIAEVTGNFDGPIGAGVPEEARNAERLVEVVRALAEVMERDAPWCLLHGDAHIGNVFLDPSGRPALLDWQLVHRGPWYVDVGYHIGSALRVPDRRRSEKDLLELYLDRLASQGVDAPGAEEARRGFCVGLVYGFFLWAITLKVRPAVTAAMLERLGTAVADHDALAVTEDMVARLR